MLYALKLASTLVLLTFSGCAMTSTAPDFSGLKDVDGSEAVHINMTKAAVHFAVAMPFIGDASLKGAVRDFTEEAKREGAERVRIVQSGVRPMENSFPRVHRTPPGYLSVCMPL